MKQMGMDPKQMEGGQDEDIGVALFHVMLEDVLKCEGGNMFITCRYDLPIVIVLLINGALVRCV